MKKFIFTLAMAAFGLMSASAAIQPGVPYRLQVKEHDLCISAKGEGEGCTHNGDNKGNLFRVEKIGDVSVSEVADNGINIEVAAGSISVYNAETVNVYRIDGCKVEAARGNAMMEVAAGLYIVKAENAKGVKTVKVLVK